MKDAAGQINTTTAASYYIQILFVFIIIKMPSPAKLTRDEATDRYT